MITEEKKILLNLFAQGRRHYKLLEFKLAKEQFGKCLAIDPQDGPSKVYFDRCEFYISNPPPDDWDGVFVMKTK